ncbi:MAG: hypothetical protein M1830_010101 [Pleopsidium flavum]|nr:MAG: hypothetical protein M1830_010101 [Pleopsidium flavum]
MSDKHEGGCFCGKVRVEYTGEPAMKVLCHCRDCRKIGGSTYSTNIAIPDSNFTLVSGTPKTISKTGDSGKTITSSFCGDCGTTLLRTGESFPGLVMVKVGVMDDVGAFKEARPGAELFAKQRVEWVPEVEGAKQLEGMA